MEFTPIVELFKEKVDTDSVFVQEGRRFGLSNGVFSFKFLVPEKITWSLKKNNQKITQRLVFDGKENFKSEFFTTLIRFATHFEKYEQFCTELYSKSKLPFSLETFMTSSLRKGVFRKKFVVVDEDTFWINKTQDIWVVQISGSDYTDNMEILVLEPVNMKIVWSGWPSTDFFALYGWLVVQDPSLEPLKSREVLIPSSLETPEEAEAEQEAEKETGDVWRRWGRVEEIDSDQEAEEIEEAEEADSDQVVKKKSPRSFFLPGDLPEGPNDPQPKSYHKYHMKRFKKIRKAAHKHFGELTNTMDYFIWACETKISNMIRYGTYDLYPSPQDVPFHRPYTVAPRGREDGFHIRVPPDDHVDAENFSVLFEIFSEARYRVIRGIGEVKIDWF